MSIIEEPKRCQWPRVRAFMLWLTDSQNGWRWVITMAVIAHLYWLLTR